MSSSMLLFAIFLCSLVRDASSAVCDGSITGPGPNISCKCLQGTVTFASCTSTGGMGAVTGDQVVVAGSGRHVCRSSVTQTDLCDEAALGGTAGFCCVQDTTAAPTCVGVTPTATFTPGTLLCHGNENGFIRVDSVGGTGVQPYSFSVNGGAFQTGTVPFLLTGAKAGPNSIVIKDSTAGTPCFSGTSVSLVDGPDAIFGLAFVSSPVQCQGGSASISTLVAGGTAPYSFSLDGGAFQTSPDFSDVAAGFHFVTIKDGSGCTTNPLHNAFVFVFDGNPTVTATPTVTNALCAGGKGSISVVGGGGVGPLFFQLDGGAFVAADPAPPALPNTKLFTNVPVGTHTVRVRDGSGCASSLVTVTVAGPAVPLAATGAVGATVPCAGSVTTVTITASGGAPAYTFAIDGGVASASNVFTGVHGGAHTVEVKDANSCVFSLAVNVPIDATLGPVCDDGSVLTAGDRCIESFCVGGCVAIVPCPPGSFTFQLDAANKLCASVTTKIPGKLATINSWTIVGVAPVSLAYLNQFKGDYALSAVVGGKRTLTAYSGVGSVAGNIIEINTGQCFIKFQPLDRKRASDYRTVILGGSAATTFP